MRLPDFQTQRLSVAHWQDALSDAVRHQSLVDRLTHTLTKPVLDPLPPSFDLTDRSVADWISDRANESDVYLICLKPDARLIGLIFWIAMDEPGNGRTAHLGYLLSQDTWGQGLATEVVQGLARAARPLKPITLFSGVARSNPGSSAVLRKAGFSSMSETSDATTDQFRLAID